MAKKINWGLKTLFALLILIAGIMINNVDSFADDVYDVWIGNEQINVKNKDNIPGKNGGYASYDPDSKTLIFYDFKDADYTSGKAVYSKTDLTILGSAQFDGVTYEQGICCDGTLSVSGNFTFKVVSDALQGKKGVIISGDSTIIDIVALGKDANNPPNGIISRNGTVDIQGGKISIKSTAYNSTGITAAIALVSGGNIVIDACYGIDCYIGTMKISGGDITINAMENGLGASTIQISGGDIDIESNNICVGAYMDIILSDGMSIIKPDGAKIIVSTASWAGIYESEDSKVEVKSVRIGKSSNQVPQKELYDVWIGSVQVTSENKNNIPGKNGGYATYDPDTKTLVFNDFKDVEYTSGAAIYSKGDLSVSGKAQLTGLSYEQGICCDGTLSVSGEFSVKSNTDAFQGEKAVTVTGDSTVIDIVVYARSSSDPSSDGILSRRGTVDIQGGKISIKSEIDESKGITASIALVSSGNITIDAGYGIDCYMGTMKISGGNIDLKVKKTGLGAGYIEISGGQIAVDSSDIGMGAYNSITLSNGMAIIEPDGAKIINYYGGWAGVYTAEGSKEEVKKLKIEKSSNITTPTPDVVTPTPDIVTPTPTPDVVTPTPDVVTPTPDIEVTAIPVPDITGTPVVTPTPEITKTANKPKKGDIITDDSDNSEYIVTSIKAGSETVSLKKPGEKSGKYVVADKVTIDGITFKVTGVYKNAFKDYTSITSVKLGKFIKSIGNSSFEGCTGLKTFTFNTKISKIGSRAFYGCSSLTKLEIPSSVTSIGKDAFKGCSSLAKLYIKTLKLTDESIGKNVFKNINKTVKIYVPKSMKKEYLELLISKGYSKKKKVNVIKNI